MANPLKRFRVNVQTIDEIRQTFMQIEAWMKSVTFIVIDEPSDDDSTPSDAGLVAGPSSSADNTIARFDGTTGLLIQGGTDAPAYDDAGNVVMAALKTVDGRDVSVDGSKLDGIEAGADVTDAANVDAAGAVMNSDFNAKGDLLVATADNTPAIVAVGTNGYALVADSGAASGVSWVDLLAGTATFLADLLDVTIDGTPADNELLAFDSATEDWINQTPAEAGVLGLAGGTMAGAIAMGTNAITGVSQLVVDSLTFDGNTISSTAGFAFKPAAASNMAVAQGGSDTIFMVMSLAALSASRTVTFPDANVNLTLVPAAALTGSRALQTSAGGVAEASAVTATELGYVSGVTSAIQTQIGTKLTSAGRRGKPYAVHATSPTGADEYFIGHTDVAITVTEVNGITDAGTVTAMLVWRARTAPFSGGTNVLSANIVFDTGEEVTTSFADATIPADSDLWMTTSAVASSPTELRANVEFTIDA